MFEQDLLISLGSCGAPKIDFVHHHHKYCCLHKNHPSDCSEVNLTEEEIGTRFLAKLTKEEINILYYYFTYKNSNLFNNCFKDLKNAIITKTPSGNIDKTQAVAFHLVNAILEEYFKGNMAAVEELVNLFKSKDDVVASLNSKFYKSKLWENDWRYFAKKYRFDKAPLGATRFGGGIYIFCSFKSSGYIDCTHIAETAELTKNTYDNQGNIGLSNIILFLPENDSNKRQEILKEILKTHSYLFPQSVHNTLLPPNSASDNNTSDL